MEEVEEAERLIVDRSRLEGNAERPNPSLALRSKGLCEFPVRRNRRCALHAAWRGHLSMMLCDEHEENERGLRAVGFDSTRDDTRVPS